MVFAAKYNHNGTWKTMYLTEKEVKEVMKEHRELSKKIMRECLLDTAKKFEAICNITDFKPTPIATVMFMKRCPQFYTMIQAKLEDKIKDSKFPKNLEDIREKQLREEKLRGDTEMM